MNKNLSNIEKLFSNYKGEYEKIKLNWDNEVGKEIWYNNKIEIFKKGCVKDGKYNKHFKKWEC